MDAGKRRGSLMPDALRLDGRKGSLPPVSFDPRKRNSLAIPTGLAGIGERRGTILSTFSEENGEEGENAEGEKQQDSLFEGLTDEDDKDDVKKLIRGKLRLENLPQPKPTSVELFLCSNGREMAEEMHQLGKRSYPELRKFCRHKYGLDFHVVDLERESRDDAVSDDHSQMLVAMDQINNTQKLSMGPYFVAFLGDKYGTVNLPQFFSKEDFEAMRKSLLDINCDVTPLDQWYWKDENDESEQYELKPISSVLGNEYTASQWELDKREVQSLVLKALERCVRVNSVSEGLTQRVQASVIEEQIEEGLFHVLKPADRNNNCFCFLRTINDLDKNAGSSIAEYYTDVQIQGDGRSTRDQDKKKALQVLKQKIKAALPTANVIEDSIRWKAPAGVDSKFHKLFFDRLVKHFTEKMKQQIDVNVGRQPTQPSHPLYLEVLQHWHFARNTTRQLQGRTSLLLQVSSYCTSITENEPLVLYGQSGCGKTSIIAKAATHLAASGQGLAVVRFCGRTADSTNINLLLRNICVHIAHLTSLDFNTIPDSDADIKRFFADLMERGIPKGSSLGKNEAFKGKIVVFLDNIDAITGVNVTRMDWLPNKLASNIKVVVATSQNAPIFQVAKEKFDSDQIVEVPPLQVNDCCVLIRDNLRWQGRKLTDVQFRIVKEIVTKCTIPLFSMLVVQDALKWKSYHEEISAEKYPHTLPTLIASFLERVETKCNAIVVTKALSLLTISQFGLSMSELEDILSLDDATLNQVFPKREPLIRRVTFSDLARIKYELKTFFVEKQVDDTSVISWKHAEFGNAARLRYLTDDQTEKDLHHLIADYFLGSYASDKKKYHKNAPSPRYVPEQPLSFKDKSSEDAKEHFNMRKLCQLPYHLAHAQLTPLLHNEVFFNYTWLKTKLKALSVQHLILDCSLTNDIEVCLLRDALLLAEEMISRDPEKLGLELSGRLLPYVTEYQVIQDLVTECDNDAPETVPVIPIMQTYLAPGGPLSCFIEPRTAAKGKPDVRLLRHNDTLLVATKPLHMSTIRLQDIVNGERITDIKCMPGTHIYPSIDGKYMCVLNETQLCTYRVDTGRLQSQIDLVFGKIVDISVSNKFAALVFESEKGPLVVNIEKGKIIKRLDYQASVILASENDQYFATNMGRCIVVYDFEKVELRIVLEVKELPHKILFSKKPHCLFMMHKEQQITKVKLDYEKRSATKSGIIEDDTLLDFSLSHKHDKILATTQLRLYVFDVATEELKGTIAQMPPEFMETMTHFKQAAFTGSDSMIVALRYMHIAFWNAHTYSPLKVVQADVHQPQRLITADGANRFVVLQNDFTVQVWNPDNVECKIEQVKLNPGGAIVATASAPGGNRVITYGQSRPGEGTVLDINKGAIELTVNISETLPEDAKVKQVSFSPKGRFLLTTIRDPGTTSLGTTSLIHTVVTTKEAASVPECIFTQISSNDDLAVFMCLKNKVYTILANHLNEKNVVHDAVLPEGELEGQPIMTDNGDYLLFIYELKPQKDRVFHQRFPEPGRKLMLCTTVDLQRSVSNKGKGLQELDYCNWKYMTKDDYLLAVYPMRSDFILLLFAEGVGNPDVKEDKENFKKQPKIAVVYSVKSKRVTKFFKNFMQRDADIDRLIISSQGTYILDQLGRIFSSADNKLLNTMTLRGIDHKTTQFLYDGKYVITMTLDHKRVIIFSSDKIEIKASIPIHGIANSFQVAKDGQILIIPSDDGRVLLFRTLLDYRSAMGPASSLVATHKFPPALKPRQEMPDDRDEYVESISMLDPLERRVIHTSDLPIRALPAGAGAEVLVKGASMRWDKLRVQHAAGAFTHRKPSLKTLAKAVTITHRNPSNKSRACVIQ